MATVATIHFADNEMGLKEWYLNEHETIIEAVPSSLNEKFKGKLLQSPPMKHLRRGVWPSISSQDGKDLKLVSIKIEEVIYSNREHPEGMAN